MNGLVSRTRLGRSTIAAAAALAVMAGVSAGSERPRPISQSAPLRVSVPNSPLPFPEPLPRGRAEPRFKIRGTKGWAWTFDQYLGRDPYPRPGPDELPHGLLYQRLHQARSVRQPLVGAVADETKRGLAAVAKACRENGIDFCFAFHPALFTQRPLRLDSDEDFEAMAAHFTYVQGLGVRWFSLLYDDIDVKGKAAAVLGAKRHAGLANRLLGRLRAKDRGVRLIFCPTYYWGTGGDGEARDYLAALGR